MRTTALIHSFGTQVRGTAFSPNVIVEHLHFESSQSCCSENRPCWMTSDASCCQLEICRTTIVHCRMVHPFVSWKERTILPRCLVSKTNCYNLQNIEVAPSFSSGFLANIDDDLALWGALWTRGFFETEALENRFWMIPSGKGKDVITSAR